MKTCLQNGMVLIDGQFEDCDVLFDESGILETGTDLKDSADQSYDCTGLHIIPGLIDLHVHLREPGFEAKETITTGTAAAAHGGFTTIAAMPNLRPFPSTPEAMKAYQDKIASDAKVRVFPMGTITDDEAGKKPTDYAALKEMGVRWFSDDGVGVADEAVMEEAMKKAKANEVLFSCHTEDMAYRKPGASVHDSAITKENGWPGIPSACEYAQLERDLDLAQKTGVRYHADHLSAKESVEAIRKAKEKGVRCSAEVTAHHLLLEDKDVKGPNWKMNPPLRSHEDRMSLIEGLEDGTLDFIASDHAPHTTEEKNRPMDKAPFGIVSLETSFRLLYTEFVSRKRRWSLAQLVNWMSSAPAKTFGIEDAGEIKPGKRADLVLIDTNRTGLIDTSKFLSKGTNTPFDGWQYDVEIIATICDGKAVWTDKQALN